jgi:methylmalonyl-CoA mutase N-terminal domain/subunit
VEAQNKIIVGVNKFVENEKVDIRIHRVTPDMMETQRKRLWEVKRNRDKQKVDKGLGEIKEAASSNENLMPHIVEAIKVYCTTGEISDALRAVYGEYKATANL